MHGLLTLFGRHWDRVLFSQSCRWHHALLHMVFTCVSIFISESNMALMLRTLSHAGIASWPTRIVVIATFFSLVEVPNMMNSVFYRLILTYFCSSTFVAHRYNLLIYYALLPRLYQGWKAYTAECHPHNNGQWYGMNESMMWIINVSGRVNRPQNYELIGLILRY